MGAQYTLWADSPGRATGRVAEGSAADQGVPSAEEAGDARPGVRASRLDPSEIGRFAIVYADPPWRYERKEGLYHVGDDGLIVESSRSQATRHYPTVETGELADLPVADILEDDALLFMWTVSTHLPDALALAPKWGFESFSTVGFVWDKHLSTVGFYNLPQCEIVLIFKHGRIPRPRGARNVKQFLSQRRTAHSRKPHEIRQRIERMFPTQSKIELFHRGAPLPGWTAWGNEVT